MISMTDGGTASACAGRRDAPVVVLVHGLGLCRDVWQFQVPELAPDFRVITYDLYGHGQSAAPPETPSLALFSDQLASVMDHWSVPRAAIVGFSLGGMIARRFAQDAPGRVNALALLHTPHRRASAAQDAIRDRVVQARDAGPAATIDAAMRRWFTTRFRDRNPQVIAQVRDWVLANDIALYHRNYAVLAEGVDEIVAPDPPIDVPTLVMTGDEDFGNGPDMAKAIAAEIEGTEMRILPGLRHMALVEDPATVNAALSGFLIRHLKGGAT